MPARKPYWKVELVKRGMTLQELAFQTGYSISIISRLSNGWTQPNARQKKMISEILNLPEERAWKRV